MFEYIIKMFIFLLQKEGELILLKSSGNVRAGNFDVDVDANEL